MIRGFVMTPIQPKGEKVRQAIRWISQERMESEKKSPMVLIQEAALKFNLSPKEEEFLRNFYQEGQD
jgi:hypothetical protein